MKTEKKLYELHLNFSVSILEISKNLKFELRRVSKLWDKTESMKYTLFSKTEIIKLMDESINDFHIEVRKELTKLMDDVNNTLKSETPGS